MFGAATPDHNSDFMGKLQQRMLLNCLVNTSQVLVTIRCLKCPWTAQTTTCYFWIFLWMIGRIAN